MLYILFVNFADLFNTLYSPLLIFLGFYFFSSSFLTLYSVLILMTFCISLLTWFLFQDSFYHNLTEEELERVQDYNFDHPGEYSWLSEIIINPEQCVPN